MYPVIYCPAVDMELCIIQFILGVNVAAGVLCYMVLSTSWLGLVSVRESRKEVDYAHMYTDRDMCFKKI